MHVSNERQCIIVRADCRQACAAASRRDCCLCTAYGSTETGTIAMTPIGQFKLGSTGQIVPNTSAKVSSAARQPRVRRFRDSSKFELRISRTTRLTNRIDDSLVFLRHCNS